MDGSVSAADSSPAGGFLPPTPSSLLASSTPSSQGPSANSFITPLPHPRQQSVRPNTTKEYTVREYATSKLSYIARRYVKKFSDSTNDGNIEGYKTFAEVCCDFDALINVLWLSGTPQLQVPFLLRVATEITDYIVSFPPEPKATFRLFRKLDHCFASLSCGKDIATAEDLPGFRGSPSSGMTTTDLVRCRSTAESTLVLLSGFLEQHADGVGEVCDSDRNGDSDLYNQARGPFPDEPEPAGFNFGVDEDASSDLDKLYEKTLLKIGERLGEDMGVADSDPPR